MSTSISISSGPPLHRVALFVAVGGGAGALARLGLSRALPVWNGSGMPWGTLLANLIACVTLGYLLGLFRRGRIPEELRQLGTSGFCGGLSTFSTFTSETFTLLERGSPYLAAGYSAGSVIVGMLAVVGGIALSTVGEGRRG
jgi:fluoride exporter